MASHNTLDKRTRDICQTMAAEAMLAKGTTYRDMAEMLNVSVRQARRIVDMFRAMGCVVTDDFTPGTQEAAKIRMTSGRLFRRHV